METILPATMPRIPSEPVKPLDARYAHIIGWGADLDHRNRPAYPMERTPPRLPNGVPPRPEQQPVRVEVLHSTEHAGITPIFGSPNPPSGLNGRLRRLAFRYSENDLRHWLVLLFADRVQVGEALVGELAKGKVPNVFAEMGGPAEVRLNPAGAAKKAAIGVGLIALLVVASRRKSRRDRQRD